MDTRQNFFILGWKRGLLKQNWSLPSEKAIWYLFPLTLDTDVFKIEFTWFKSVNVQDDFLRQQKWQKLKKKVNVLRVHHFVGIFFYTSAMTFDFKISRFCCFAFFVTHMDLLITKFIARKSHEYFTLGIFIWSRYIRRLYYVLWKYLLEEKMSKLEFEWTFS